MGVDKDSVALRRSHRISILGAKTLAGSNRRDLDILKKNKNLKPDDHDELGTKWILVAQEAETKLVIRQHVGGRALGDAVELLSDVESR